MIRKTMILLGLSLAVAACNTVAGVGEDISAGARTVQNAF